MATDAPEAEQLHDAACLEACLEAEKHHGDVAADATASAPNPGSADDSDASISSTSSTSSTSNTISAPAWKVSVLRTGTLVYDSIIQHIPKMTRLTMTQSIARRRATVSLST